MRNYVMTLAFAFSLMLPHAVLARWSRRHRCLRASKWRRTSRSCWSRLWHAELRLPAGQFDWPRRLGVVHAARHAVRRLRWVHTRDERLPRGIVSREVPANDIIC